SIWSRKKARQCGPPSSICRCSSTLPRRCSRSRIRLISARPEPRAMKKVALGLTGWLLTSIAASAQTPFAGKTINMIVGFAAGGGTDAYGRLTASFFPKFLPGAPSFEVRNIPGAEGITAMNYIVQQVEPDGFTIAVASSTTADPLNYRKPQSQFDATRLEVIGGAARGGEIML